MIFTAILLALTAAGYFSFQWADKRGQFGLSNFFMTMTIIFALTGVFSLVVL